MASGAYSGNHEIDGIGMLELAMPIEPGNSGGPVLTSDGKVVGLVTMKSSVKDSVGYALSAKLIRQLIDEPNPVPMASLEDDRHSGRTAVEDCVRGRMETAFRQNSCRWCRRIFRWSNIVCASKSVSGVSV